MLILLFNLVFDLSNSNLSFNIPKLSEYYYNFYINFYLLYKIIKNFLIFLYHIVFKIYLIFLNSNASILGQNTFWFSFFLKLKKFIRWLLFYFFKRILKLKKKYRSYYRFYNIAYLKIFLISCLIFFFIILWKNRVVYKRINLLTYIIAYYLLVVYLCFIMIPLFYYNFLGFFFILILSYLLCHFTILK